MKLLKSDIFREIKECNFDFVKFFAEFVLEQNEDLDNQRVDTEALAKL